MVVSAGVLAYDIADDRRRTAVRKLLEEYGLPVQESVFMLELSTTQWRELRQRLLRLVDRGEDDVQVWRLCVACQTRAQAWCGAPTKRTGPVAIV